MSVNSYTFFWSQASSTKSEVDNDITNSFLLVLSSANFAVVLGIVEFVGVIITMKDISS